MTPSARAMDFYISSEMKEFYTARISPTNPSVRFGITTFNIRVI